MKPVCSIVIRAFNEEKHIGRLLDGIAQQTVKDVQVILVDSGSSDNTVSIAKKHAVDVVNISPHEFTFGHSLNVGISQAKADLVLIASAHVYPVYPDWIERMLEPFRDEKIALVYGKQRGVAASQFSEQQIFTHWYPDDSQPQQDHPFCNNANAAIRKALWQEHPYDESLPGLEDLEWAQWTFDQGYKIAYIAEAEIIHVHNESWRGVHKRYTREGMAFKQIYPQETFSIIDLVRLFLKNSFSDMGEAIHQRVFWRQFANILRFRWMQFHGTYLGYKRSGPLTWQLKQSFYYPRGNGEKNGNSSRRDVKPISYD
jgi:glycosyltransferase involved in cell wall biosynthesis